MTTLVPFKGNVSAYGLFRAGNDTTQIAELLSISEAEASWRVFKGRCRFLKLPLTVEPRSDRRPGRTKVPA